MRRVDLDISFTRESASWLTDSFAATGGAALRNDRKSLTAAVANDHGGQERVICDIVC